MVNNQNYSLFYKTSFDNDIVPDVHPVVVLVINVNVTGNPTLGLVAVLPGRLLGVRDVQNVPVAVVMAEDAREIPRVCGHRFVLRFIPLGEIVEDFERGAPDSLPPRSRQLQY